MPAALASLLAFPVFVVLGALLRARTHHHALAGVTYAVCALFAGAASWLIAGRMLSLWRRRGALRGRGVDTPLR